MDGMHACGVSLLWSSVVGWMWSGGGMGDTTTRLRTTHHRTDDRTESGRDDGMIDVVYRVPCTVDRWRDGDNNTNNQYLLLVAMKGTQIGVMNTKVGTNVIRRSHDHGGRS
jgi:hypothetical protein